MQFGLSEHIIDSISAVFKKHKEVTLVILYGSRATGTFREGSDIDLTIKDDGLSSTLLLTIKDELDDLLLPQEIDLSLFSQIKNQDLIHHINDVGVVFYQESL